MIEFMEIDESAARIRVVGVGGGGGNAINTMISGGMGGVDFIAANTDAQALSQSLASMKIQMGESLTRGLGAGANPEIGRNAAMEAKDRIAEVLDGADMVFITGGMGGGTGTGGAPVIAEVARSLGCLTVGVVTRPFRFEGRRRARQAEQGIQELKATVDTLITIPNEKLVELAGENLTMVDAFGRVDQILHNAVQGISDLVVVPGMINVDFADVRTVMQSRGLALMGTGSSTGQNRALEAVHRAVSSPLLEEVAIDGATGILLNVTGPPDMRLFEVNECAVFIQEAAHDEANIIFGAVVDERLGEKLKVTVIATGFEGHCNELISEQPQYAFRPIEEDLDIPTHIRKSARMTDVPSIPPPVGERAPRAIPTSIRQPIRELKSVAESDVVRALEEEEYDVPTFLRRPDR
ncbi:MAG: cell division protein FtsZ [Deltaproteobacteria bacterium]|nr:cell division protein FtsZ [Deltaproteobacteria bacterium]